MSPEPVPPARGTARAVLLTLLAAVLVAASGCVTITVPRVPGTTSALPWAVELQAATVILVGLVLGWRRAVSAVVLVGIAVAAGAPVAETLQSGQQLLAGTQLGYAAALPLIALVVGVMVERNFPRFHAAPAWWTSLACLAMLYGMGASWAIWGRAQAPLDAAVVALGRLPADVGLVGVAVLLAKLVYQLFPRVIEDRWWNQVCPPVPDSLRGEDVPVDACGMVRG